MNPQQSANIDPIEIAKFEQLAARWWDRNSEFKPLHDINPLRLDFIKKHVDINERKVLDVGCGGGILSESMALSGAKVTGIDMGKAPLSVAKLHLLESGANVDYRQTTVEALAESEAGQYDVVTCMEMLEHVPDPASVIAACRRLVNENGYVFFSTINRNPKSYLFAILGAEYVLRLLPKGTHEYNKFIKPSELDAWARQTNLQLEELKGMTYNPFNQSYKLGTDTDVNYLVAYRAAD